MYFKFNMCSFNLVKEMNRLLSKGMSMFLMDAL